MKYETAAPMILKYISEGNTQKDAFTKAGVSESIFYKWMSEKPVFADGVRQAQEDARFRHQDVLDTERALLDIAKGFDIHEIRTEYGTKYNTKTGKYDPVIIKQRRTVKRVVPNVEAIKFYLTNRAPELWKNKVEQTNLGGLDTNIVVRYIGKEGDELFPSSESEVDLHQDTKYIHNQNGEG